MNTGKKFFIILVFALTAAAVLIAEGKETKTEADGFIGITNGEFMDVSSDDFKPVNENSLQAEKESGLIRMIIENNILFLIAGIILGFTAFILKLKRTRYLFLLASLVFLGFYAGGCNCSVGAVMKFFYYLFYDHNKLFITSALILIPVISTLLFGRVFCGYVCPLGALQEFVAVRDRLIKIDIRTEKVLKILRVILIILIIVISIIKHDLIYTGIFPFKAIFNINGALIQVISAVLLLLISLFIYRPFCRFLCPLAILLEIAGKFSVFKIKKDKLSCDTCSLCRKKCNVNAIDKNCNIDNGLCIRCGECLTCHKNK